ncbi:hypothetical protein HYU20_01510 [Candidatus Woesearchaeota archaeon]|nr:hypothetical protein [Candidatus Woesearchaeota archaeon]
MGLEELLEELHGLAIRGLPEPLQDLAIRAFPPRRRLVVTTYDHTAPVSKSDAFEGTNTYGRLYAKVLELLVKKGWTVKSCPVWSLEDAGSNDLEEVRLAAEETAVRISRMRPSFVFHEPEIFQHQLRHFLKARHPEGDEESTSRTSSLITSTFHSRLYERLKGRVERIGSPCISLSLSGQDIGDKGVFYEVAQRLGVPVPKTKVIPIIDDSSWDPEVLSQQLTGADKDLAFQYFWWRNYGRLAQHLTGKPDGEIIIKLCQESGGKHVYLIRSQGDLEAFIQKERTDGNFAVAQERIALPSGWPYSIRVVTWQGKPVGAALLVNSSDGYRSNAKQGGFAVDLALAGYKPRTDTLLMSHLQPEEMGKLEDIAALCGIDLKARRLPSEVEELARLIGRYPSDALLRGHDFMYNMEGAPVALESNPHPGPPGTGMFSALAGMPKQSTKKEIAMGARLIAYAIHYN